MMNIGIIGLGHIAQRVSRGITFAQDATLYAVASRDIKKATIFKEEHQAYVAYGSYEEMLMDENVDMVYICTPNMLHIEHIMMCLKHKKHVLCEKPFVSNMKQLKQCFAYAKQQGCFLMEAQKTLFTPLNRLLKSMVEGGAIGKLQYIEAGYCANMQLDTKEKDSWLFHLETGGSFYDVGVYPICYSNYFASANVRHVNVMKRIDIRTGIDQSAQALLGYENGVMSYVRSSWGIDMINQAYLYGSEGVIITDNFWKSTTAILRKDGHDELIKVEMQSDFTGEIEHACECIMAGLLESPILSETKSEEIMKIIEKIHECDCVHLEKSVK